VRLLGHLFAAFLCPVDQLAARMVPFLALAVGFVGLAGLLLIAGCGVFGRRQWGYSLSIALWAFVAAGTLMVLTLHMLGRARP